ncbi:MAG: SRPBCC family protein [Cyanobacteria bacterium SZAS-4]|nr:SRPBCC family protein [Cyanobacteria bacterium SZAS-4]
MNQHSSRSAKIRVTVSTCAVLLLSLSAQTPGQAFKFPGQKASTTTKETSGTEAPKLLDVVDKPASEKQRIQSKILIKAPPEVVWFSVHEERKHDPDIAYSKVLEQGVNEQKLEQKFCLLPVIGSATCVMHHTEVPNQRIDYKLLKSDHFKAMEGSWVFTPAENGKATVLELSTHLDMGVPVPKMIFNNLTQKKLDKRLAHIKEMAEGMHSKVAAGTAKTE